jgi:hypothetical protein
VHKYIQTAKVEEEEQEGDDNGKRKQGLRTIMADKI